MPGATAIMAKLPIKIENGSTIRVTPEMAIQLLEANQHNRPLSQRHVERIASQIRQGKWRYNGDTIKIAKGGSILDGQHRLWAIIEAKSAVETMVATGIDPEAFATVDTISKPRSLGDTVALAGVERHRSMVATALAWLIRWQRKCLESYHAPQNRIENSDIVEALSGNPGIVRAAERATTVRNIANTSIVTFLYYIISNRDEELAERMINTLADPAGIALTDPFFKLRTYFISDHHKRKEALVTIAIAFKAINAAAKAQRVHTLSWKQQGKTPEAFPVLDI